MKYPLWNCTDKYVQLLKTDLFVYVFTARIAAQINLFIPASTTTLWTVENFK